MISFTQPSILPCNWITFLSSETWQVFFNPCCISTFIFNMLIRNAPNIKYFFLGLFAFHCSTTSCQHVWHEFAGSFKPSAHTVSLRPLNLWSPLWKGCSLFIFGCKYDELPSISALILAEGKGHSPQISHLLCSLTPHLALCLLDSSTLLYLNFSYLPHFLSSP